MAVVLVINQRVLHKAPQQSVQRTGGSLRVFQAFFWRWFFPTSQTLSTPTHPPLTQTVGRWLRYNNQNDSVLKFWVCIKT
jgi:hypothetical protein